MAINLDKISINQVSGGLSNPAPAVYSIYYNGSSDDFKVAADVTLFCNANDIFVGDGCIIRFETAGAGAKANNVGLFIGTPAAITLEVATMAALP